MIKRCNVRILLVIYFCLYFFQMHAQHGNKFEPLGTLLPTPNEYRTASGAPGPAYWQQKVDYDINCQLDDKEHRITGSETITYYNNSPDVLTYLWLSLEENIYSFDRNANYQYSNGVPERVTEDDIKNWDRDNQPNDYGVNITSVTDAAGNKVKFIINRTMMRVDLASPLKSKSRTVLKISWNYKLTNRMEKFGRGGYEFFTADSNSLYTITHWYPRICQYSDYAGWHNQQYANKEFALPFGNFNVKIKVPADHIVGATGECINYKDVLSPEHYSRLQKARNASSPVNIVTLEDATKNQKSRSKNFKTWVFKAENVRDFAWTSSKRFIWDGMSTNINGKNILCMSYYGREAYPIYHQTSTKVVAHTLKTYSDYLFPYPYPVAQSVEASNGIEFPMICFNLGRTQKDGSFTEQTKMGAIRTIIHEVGHNYFPMIINTDERQWAWMDEGFDSFVEQFAEQTWDSTLHWPTKTPDFLVPLLQKDKSFQEPIMTYPDNQMQYPISAYFKPAVALNILRNTVMGHERFDTAFKTYARRWAFKQPIPADFFRTMEDASADDLDWFWRGWFYGKDVCDIAIDTVKYFTAGEGNHFYQVEMSNRGGLVMPVILQFNYDDHTRETIRIPAQVWRHNEKNVTKSYLRHKKITSIVVDPNHETADIDGSNNTWNRFKTPADIAF